MFLNRDAYWEDTEDRETEAETLTQTQLLILIDRNLGCFEAHDDDNRSRLQL